MGEVAGPPLVDIVVLNFNGTARLAACLDSLLETDYANYRIVVVDNDSHDGSWQLAQRYGDPVALIRNARNLGWSGGNNVGIGRCLADGAEYVVLANNDIKVHPAWIREAVAAAQANADVGVVGFTVFEADNPAVAQAAFEAASRAWRAAPAVPAGPVGGMAMFVRARLFQELGLFDESFWAYAEDVDFLRRVALAGYAVVRVSVPVWHFGSASFGRVPLRAALLQTENNIQLLLKYEGLRELLRAGVRHVWQRCLPRRGFRAPTPVEQRLGGQSFLINAALLAIASARILVKLPRILRNRRAVLSTTSAIRLQRHRAQ